MRTLLTVVAALPLVVPAGPACAHAILMQSTPALRASVPPGPADIVLRFNSRIDQGRSRIELRKPGSDAAAQVLTLVPSGPDTLAAKAPLASGDWVLRWQVLATDGHMTRGDVPFTVQAK